MRQPVPVTFAPTKNVRVINFQTDVRVGGPNVKAARRFALTNRFEPKFQNFLQAFQPAFVLLHFCEQCPEQSATNNCLNC